MFTLCSHFDDFRRKFIFVVQDEQKEMDLLSILQRYAVAARRFANFAFKAANVTIVLQKCANPIILCHISHK